jgi:16S rRNA (guanine527-N7)-methyltransferase
LSEEQPSPENEPTTLAEALAIYEIELPADQIERLDAYRVALWEWNEKLNLTRHTTLDKYVARDLVDTLELSKLLGEGERVLDVGSGGGVPGLPLAILRPDLKVSVCESVAKKANVLQAIVEDLSLPVKVYPARVEQVIDPKAGGQKFDTLIARAVAPMWKFLFWLKPHSDTFGRLLLIKGPGWIAERGEARHRGLMRGFDLRRVEEYTTPRTDAISTILSITKGV